MQRTIDTYNCAGFDAMMPPGITGAMALTNRYKTATGAGTLAALVLVLVFGSPWYRDWVTDNTTDQTGRRLVPAPARLAGLAVRLRVTRSRTSRRRPAGDPRRRAHRALPLPAARHPARPGPRHAQPVLRRLGRVRLRRRVRRPAHHAGPQQPVAAGRLPGRRRRARPTASSSAGSSASPPWAAGAAPGNSHPAARGPRRPFRRDRRRLAGVRSPLSRCRPGSRCSGCGAG